MPSLKNQEGLAFSHRSKAKTLWAILQKFLGLRATGVAVPDAHSPHTPLVPTDAARQTLPACLKTTRTILGEKEAGGHRQYISKKRYSVKKGTGIFVFGWFHRRVCPFIPFAALFTRLAFL